MFGSLSGEDQIFFKFPLGDGHTCLKLPFGEDQTFTKYCKGESTIIRSSLEEGHNFYNVAVFQRMSRRY